MNVLIAGGSGLVGQKLSKLLSDQGHHVSWLTRRPSSTGLYSQYFWNPMSYDPATSLASLIDMQALEQADCLINLAGAGIADKRWTDARKKFIIDSRVKGNQLLAAAIAQCSAHYPTTYISASAIGYYGNRPNEKHLAENTNPGQGFLSKSVSQWEKSIELVAAQVKRAVVLRIGIVLDTDGGALPKILMPFRFGVGNYFGNGRQVYSWIHWQDLVRLFATAVDQSNLQGTYNAVAPWPRTNRDITQVISAIKHPILGQWPVPSWVLAIALGEMSAAVLDSCDVSAHKVLGIPFEFHYPTLEEAMHQLFQ